MSGLPRSFLVLVVALLGAAANAAPIVATSPIDGATMMIDIASNGSFNITATTGDNHFKRVEFQGPNNYITYNQQTGTVAGGTGHFASGLYDITVHWFNSSGQIQTSQIVGNYSWDGSVAVTTPSSQPVPDQLFASTIVNDTDGTQYHTIEAFDENGNLIGSTTVTLRAGESLPIELAYSESFDVQTTVNTRDDFGNFTQQTFDLGSSANAGTFETFSSFDISTSGITGAPNADLSEVVTTNLEGFDRLDSGLQAVVNQLVSNGDQTALIAAINDVEQRIAEIDNTPELDEANTTLDSINTNLLVQSNQYNDELNNLLNVLEQVRDGTLKVDAGLGGMDVNVDFTDVRNDLANLTANQLSTFNAAAATRDAARNIETLLDNAVGGMQGVSSLDSRLTDLTTDSEAIKVATQAIVQGNVQGFTDLGADLQQVVSQLVANGDQTLLLAAIDDVEQRIIDNDFTDVIDSGNNTLEQINAELAQQNSEYNDELAGLLGVLEQVRDKELTLPYDETNPLETNVDLTEVEADLNSIQNKQDGSFLKLQAMQLDLENALGDYSASGQSLKDQLDQLNTGVAQVGSNTANLGNKLDAILNELQNGTSETDYSGVLDDIRTNTGFLDTGEGNPTVGQILLEEKQNRDNTDFKTQMGQTDSAIVSQLTSVASTQQSVFDDSLTGLSTVGTLGSIEIGGNTSGWPTFTLPVVGAVDTNPFVHFPWLSGFGSWCRESILWLLAVAFVWYIKEELDKAFQIILTTPQNQAQVGIENNVPFMSHIKHYSTAAVWVVVIAGVFSGLVVLMNTQITAVSLGTMGTVQSVIQRGLSTGPDEIQLIYNFIDTFVPLPALIQFVAASLIFGILKIPAYVGASAVTRNVKA